MLAVASAYLISVASAGAAAAAPPKPRALLIGVGDYPALPAALHLAAPQQDVERLRAALLGAGLDPAAVQVMSERDGERPTRAAILAALRRLADEARPGQQVLVYFSGHGAQAPARHPAREPDGLEELYLAADAARWDGGKRAVPGSIADFEMEAALQAIRDRGAEVWFVADACHAAGLTRGPAPAGERAKAVSAYDLGIPISRFALRTRSSEAAPLAPGGFAGFYAAAPGALAVERPLPAGSPDARPQSVFTYALVRALAQGRFRTLRDLALAVSAATSETGPGAPAPVFEGGLSDSVLGLTPAVRAFRVRRTVDGLSVAAGAVEGLDAGSQVELTDGSNQPVGRAVVLRSGLEAAELRPLGPIPDGPLLARLAVPAQAGEGGRGSRLLAALAGHARAVDGLQLEARRLSAGCAPNPPARLGFPPEGRPLELLAPEPLRHCDVLYVRIANEGAAALDVTPLYVDAAGGVAALSFAPEDDVRLEPGQARFIALRVLTRDSAGRPLPHGVERLALIAAPARGARLDLRGLAGPAVMRGSEAAPDVDRPGLAALVFPLRVQD